MTSRPLGNYRASGPLLSPRRILASTILHPCPGGNAKIGFGLGGIHVEILGDVRFRITPLTDLDAADLIRGIKGYRLLQGYRGHPPADVDAIAELLLRLSRLVEELSEIVELDLNPIFALPPGQGCKIVDARIRVKGCALEEEDRTR